MVKIQVGRQQLPFESAVRPFVSLEARAGGEEGEHCSCLPDEEKRRGE